MDSSNSSSDDDTSAPTTDYYADDEECPTPTYLVDVASSTPSTDSGSTSDTDSAGSSQVFPRSYYKPVSPDPDQSLLQAIHSGRGIIPPGRVTKKESPLPYGAVLRLYLPLEGEPGFFKAMEDAPAIYKCIKCRSPIPNELLVGYEPEDDDHTTASRRHHVTEYYSEMMTARLGRVEEDGIPRKSARIARKGAPPATTSQGGPDTKRHWFE